jgi:hypothetical protein
VEDADYGLPGEVGTELGAHQPDVAQSVCALNSVVKTDLAIIDALEGGDGHGHWMRLDTLIAGRNPLATDTVAMAMAGVSAADHPTFSLCAERGLGPIDLDEIEVVGESIEDAAFHLERLRDNVLEMPLPFCLALLGPGDLDQIHRALVVYGFLPEDAEPPQGRQALIDALAAVVGSSGYYEQVLSKSNGYTHKLLGLIVEGGGTSGSMAAVQEAFDARWDDLYYWPAARTLTRLGLAYAVEGMSGGYYLLAEGVSEAFRRQQGADE